MGRSSLMLRGQENQNELNGLVINGLGDHLNKWASRDEQSNK